MNRDEIVSKAIEKLEVAVIALPATLELKPANTVPKTEAVSAPNLQTTGNQIRLNATGARAFPTSSPLKYHVQPKRAGIFGFLRRNQTTGRRRPPIKPSAAKAV